MRPLAALLFALTLWAAPVGAQQNSDVGFLAGVLQDSLSGAGREVRISGFRGALSARAELDRLTIADADGVWLTLENAVLDWDRRALLRGRVEVRQLTAERLIMPRRPLGEDVGDAAEASGFSFPKLPVAVNIAALGITSVDLGPTVLGQAAKVALQGAAQLENGDAVATLALTRIDSRQGDITFDLLYASETDFLTFDLALSEAPNGLISNIISLPDSPSIDLRIEGAGPFDAFAATLDLDTNGEDRLQGTATLDQSQAGVQRFEADLSGDVTALLVPQYRDLLGSNLALTLRGQASDRGTRLETLDLSGRALSLTGSADIGADGVPQAFDLTGRLADPDGASLPLGEGLNAQSIDLQARFDAQAGPDWIVALGVQAPAMPGFDAQELTLRGTGQIAPGTSTNIAANLAFEGTEVRFADPAVQAMLGPAPTGSGALSYAEDTGFVFDDIALAGARAALSLSGTITGQDGTLILSTAGRADVSDLSPLGPIQGAAALSFQATSDLIGGALSASATGQARDLSSDVDALAPFLEPGLALDLALERDTEGLRLTRAEFGNDTATVSARGTLNSQLSNLRAEVDLPRLALLPEVTGGAANLSLVLQQAGDAPWTASVSGATRGLSTTIPQANAVLGPSVDLSASATLASAVTLDAFSLSSASALITGSGEFEGGAGALSYTAELSDPGALTGARSGPMTANGKVTFAQGTTRATLEAVAQNLAVGVAQADSLLRGQTRLSAALVAEADRITLTKAEVSNGQLAASATGPVAPAFDLQTSARIANLASIAPGLPGPLSASGRVRQAAQGIALDLALTGPGGSAAQVTGLAGLPNGQQALAINGTVPLALANGFIAPRVVGGQANVNLTLNGAAELSALSGQITLQDARASAPSFGQVIRPITGTITLSGGTATLAIKGSSGGGGLGVTGSLGLAPPFRSDLSVSMRDVLVEDPALFQTRLNGTVSLTGALATQAVARGEILLDVTEVRIPTAALGGVTDIPDIEHLRPRLRVSETLERADLLGSEVTGQGGGGQIQLDLTVRAAQAIFVRGRGLDAELDGALSLTGPLNDIRPAGGFRLTRGRLDLLGRRLTMVEGSAELTGSFDPFIRFVAEAPADSVVVQVIIEGAASAPSISFASTPSLPESEVLSQLIFGDNVSGLSPFQAAQLASAVRELTGRGNGGIVARIREETGLDDLSVDQDANGDTSVSAGKYIADNVYSEVEVGAQGDTNVTLNIDLTPSITATGTVGSGGETRLGIFFEKDY